MCTNPRLIKNPNFGLKTGFSYQKDCVSKYIRVPCGHCVECIHLRQLSYSQRTQLECLNNYPFFCVLTYNNDMIPVYETSSGYKIRYADQRDVVNMIKRLRKRNAFGRPFSYLVVSERGEEHGRPHFHILFFIQKFSDDDKFVPNNLEALGFKEVLKEWSRNVGSRSHPVYKPLCTYYRRMVFGKLSYNYDFHFVSPLLKDGTTSGISYYVTKYMFKDSQFDSRLHSALKLNLPDDEFKEVWRIVRSRSFSSLNFGFGLHGYKVKTDSKNRLKMLSETDAFKYVRKSIDRSSITESFPKVYDLETGRSMPMARYFYNFGNLYTEFDTDLFYNNRKDSLLAGNVSLSARDSKQLKQVSDSKEKIRSLINNVDSILDFV